MKTGLFVSADNRGQLFIYVEILQYQLRQILLAAVFPARYVYRNSLCIAASIPKVQLFKSS